MRCYFYFVNGNESVRYDQGVEASDILAVQHLAHHAIHKIQAEADRANEEWRGWRLNVVDASGGVLLSISLDLPLRHGLVLTR